MLNDNTDLEVQFYMSADSSVTELETFRIHHPSFSQVFNLTFSDAVGFEAKLESGETVDFEYLPMSFTGSTLASDLDYGVNITIGDLGSRIQKELDRVDADGTWHIYPVVECRTYRSDRLDRPMRGPINLQIANYTYNSEGFAFLAQAPDIKYPGTGTNFTLERFVTMLAYFYA